MADKAERKGRASGGQGGEGREAGQGEGRGGAEHPPGAGAPAGTVPERDRPGPGKAVRLRNRMQVPEVKKVVVNMGLGEAVANVKVIDVAVAEMAGHHRPETRGHAGPRNPRRPSSCGPGMPIGCKVTLRGERMYEFLDRLLCIALPRIRDFRGVPASPSTGAGTTRWASASS